MLKAKRFLEYWQGLYAYRWGGSEYQGLITEQFSFIVALCNASSEVTITGLREEISKNTANWRLSRVLRLCLIIKEMDLIIWLLSRSIIQNREIMSFANSDKQARKSSSDMTPSYSFLARADTNSVTAMLAITKMPSGLSNSSFTFSEPASIWYLLTRALVSKKYKDIIYFFLLQYLPTKRSLLKKDDFLHPQGLFQERRIPIGHNHNRRIISVPTLKATSMPQVSLKTLGEVKHLILFLKKACQFLLY